MKRNCKLLLLLLIALVLLSACASKPDPNDFPDITQNFGPTNEPTATPTQEPVVNQPAAEGGESIFSANPYDVIDEDMLANMAASEENYVDPNYGVENLYSYDAPAGTVYPYAGTTPIPLNPVDMPTPTPRPDLTFTYAAYTANTVGVTFEAPTNWQIDQSQSGLFILSEPQNQVKDNQACELTISAEPVSTNYSRKDLESHVTQRLNTIGGVEFAEWSPSYTATRHMMGTEGVYANYSGMLSDGTEVGGRIHYVCIGNTLYGLEIRYPLGFKDDFLDVFKQVRSTLSAL